MKYLLLLSIIFNLSFGDTFNPPRKEPKQLIFERAVMYALGTNVPRDERRAFHLFHKAARQGHLEATYLVGVSFDQGRGVRVQKELARYWFKLAAKRGHAQASFRLSSLNRKLFSQPRRYARR